MRQYNILRHGKDEIFLSEGLPNSIYEPGKRMTFASESQLLGYLQEHLPQKKVRINISPDLGGLEEAIRGYRPKLDIQTNEFRRGVPPPADQEH
jgi:hypothetical protein